MLVSERAGLPLTNGQWSKSDSIKIYGGRGVAT